MKIAIVVQGRFHAFDLARALINRGHDVTVFTNYPKWAVRRFGILPGHVRSFWLHGVVSKLASWFHERALWLEPERWLHPVFGRWVVAQLANGPMRTAEIRRSVDDVYEKMLIQTLRKLEGFGLVSRRSYPQLPPRVEYRLTPLGRSLARLAGLFGRWVERNVINLLRAEEDGKAA